MWTLRLTDHGRGLARRLQVAPWDVPRRALGVLDEDERAALVSGLRKVASRVSELVEEEAAHGFRR